MRLFRCLLTVPRKASLRAATAGLATGTYSSLLYRCSRTVMAAAPSTPPHPNDSNEHKSEHAFTNSLINEKSPYLLQHAHNPVNWYPWSNEALHKAKQENKLIFLSVGYSTCHWCHVMERESFENEAVAKILNDHFVCIKVDREERPDIDKIYMNYVTAITQHGGWPMSVWLAPEGLTPIYGGTYYPKQHFVSILQRLSELWSANESNLIDRSKHVMEALQSAMNKDDIDETISDTQSVFEAMYSQFQKRFDKALGGFGNAPKFPRPVELDFLLRYYYNHKDTEKGKNALKMATKTLDAMAKGGIYDHLGYGFHRYSVDEYFHVPHFEKMLYDNAQLIVTYLNAYQITKTYFYKQVAMQTLQYLLRDMKMPNGGIYSAEDADSLNADDPEQKEKKEGAFYIFKQEEFDTLLTKNEAIVLKELYFIKKEGNCSLSMRSDPHKEFVGYNVLYKRTNDLIEVFNKLKSQLDGVESLTEMGELIRSGNKKLFEYRCKRARPHLDNKIICAWNGLVLSSFAVAHKVLRLADGDNEYHPDNSDIYLKTAKEIAQFIYDEMRDKDTGFIYRIYGKTDIYGFSIDYSFLIRGVLDLYEASFEVKWLKWAMELQDIQNTLFFDEKLGAYFDTVEKSENIIMRLKEEYDGAEPCASSVAVQNLLRLHAFTKRDKYLKVYAQKTLEFMNDTLARMPFAIPACALGLDLYESGMKQVVISSRDHPEHVGDNLNDDEKEEAYRKEQIGQFLNVLYGGYYPDAVCVVLDDSNYDEMQNEINEMYGVYTRNKESKIMAHVCRQFACKQPTNDLSEFESQIAS